jgi:hypothetical protein
MKQRCAALVGEPPSSHAAGVIERFRIDGAPAALREFAMPDRVDEEHV